MKCPSCGCDNREGAKFCGECAAPLAAALACPSCGTANPKGRKFCDSCGQPLAEPSAPDPRSYTPKHLAEKILTSRAALEGERKQVTVLFADVKGSMDLAEQVDPEEWHAIMDRFFHDPRRGRSSLRGDDQPVHRRRHHGAVRGADRARGPRAARLLAVAPSARGLRALRGRAAPHASGQLRGAHGAQLGRGRGRQDR